MKTMVDETPALSDDPPDVPVDDRPRENPQGSDNEVSWIVVEKTAGITPATIIANRLISEGIPARARQEGAGQAIGLTVGLLGNGYVVVPEEFVDQAEKILSESWDSGEMEDILPEEED
ncbi:MAG: hypothetical protein BMS9Abin02_0389 [Anaerolineae bacterium]|nr:MAG: hypothetical protein BMS9Abin02_0389 [Anaerolineae bacterium]